VLERRLATVYRFKEEQENFSGTLAKKFLANQDEAKEIVEQALEIQAQLEVMFQESEIFTLEFFNTFRTLYDSYLPYFLGTMWAANAFTAEQAPELMSLLEEGRKKTEKFYTASEVFLNRYFKYVADCERDTNLDIYTTLTDEELALYLYNNTLPDKELLQQRYEYSLIVSSDGKSRLLSGEDARKEVGARFPAQVTTNVREFKGNVANRGIAKGKVCIILRPEDMAKMTEGDILVTAMTRPDWISAIQKAGAIVTDVGGTLCHAAIVSRELNKPCIIGTQVATQVLKNGDLVEVDADKGVVIILSR